MRRLVYYSLALPHHQARPDLLWQLEASVSSLRQHNHAIPIVLFLYGDMPAAAARALASLRVRIWSQGSYEARLARLLPRGWQVLAHYPLLHKFLNFDGIAALAPDQVLFLDCDTLFAGNVEELFERYGEADCCAREEPTCARSHYGYDAGYLDEAAVAQVAAREGIRVPPPFNLGVVLWNHSIWNRLPQLDAIVVWYAWRFLVWLAMHPARDRALAYGESDAARLLAHHFAQITTDEDVRGALPYPSSNRWILDQLALWFALGHVPALRYLDFSPTHVLQNGEFSSSLGQADWILCHYFSQNLERISAWTRQRGNGTCGCAGPPRPALGTHGY